MIDNTLSPSTVDALTSFIESSPSFKAILNELVESLPDTIAESAVEVKEEVASFALAKLRESLSNMDTRKIAEAVLANDRLRGKIKVEIDDLGLGVSQRLQADIKELMTTEINLTRNLLTARREKKRAQRAELASELSDRRQEWEKAWLKVQLAWMKVTRASVATPFVMIGALVGAIAFANYVPAIACHKGDAICHLRVRPGIFPAK
ncbi:MAG: hypothetical protein HC852_11250 [Acaryochloridaceae cyanobacterium RU_4_10]|nr:hypothetical protein [Acaryochloridaceae cyanobacterium RU_4_10]